ncbi:hypothetical protein BLNAU_18633 [Blattamonas nauphoetae]|uniref:Uncharacterized protein n=1 Tax=Blattamonas nauphoetae TaxID=2049346 RepID=A0ABQ9X4E5_9EUKA|nr:hypothetical protein BLNAU_18633 [Blattamonas nauphoetae]
MIGINRSSEREKSNSNSNSASGIVAAVVVIIVSIKMFYTTNQNQAVGISSKFSAMSLKPFSKRLCSFNSVNSRIYSWIRLFITTKFVSSHSIMASKEFFSNILSIIELFVCNTVNNSQMFTYEISSHIYQFLSKHPRDITTSTSSSRCLEHLIAISVDTFVSQSLKKKTALIHLCDTYLFDTIENVDIASFNTPQDEPYIDPNTHSHLLLLVQLLSQLYSVDTNPQCQSNETAVILPALAHIALLTRSTDMTLSQAAEDLMCRLTKLEKNVLVDLLCSTPVKPLLTELGSNLLDQLQDNANFTEACSYILQQFRKDSKERSTPTSSLVGHHCFRSNFNHRETFSSPIFASLPNRLLCLVAKQLPSALQNSLLQTFLPEQANWTRSSSSLPLFFFPSFLATFVPPQVDLSSDHIHLLGQVTKILFCPTEDENYSVVRAEDRVTTADIALRLVEAMREGMNEQEACEYVLRIWLVINVDPFNDPTALIPLSAVLGQLDLFDTERLISLVCLLVEVAFPQKLERVETALPLLVRSGRRLWDLAQRLSHPQVASKATQILSVLFEKAMVETEQEWEDVNTLLDDVMPQLPELFASTITLLQSGTHYQQLMDVQFLFVTSVSSFISTSDVTVLTLAILPFLSNHDRSVTRHVPTRDSSTFRSGSIRIPARFTTIPAPFLRLNDAPSSPRGLIDRVVDELVEFVTSKDGQRDKEQSQMICHLITCLDWSIQSEIVLSFLFVSLRTTNSILPCEDPVEVPRQRRTQNTNSMKQRRFIIFGRIERIMTELKHFIPNEAVHSLGVNALTVLLQHNVTRKTSSDWWITRACTKLRKWNGRPLTEREPSIRKLAVIVAQTAVDEMVDRPIVNFSRTSDRMISLTSNTTRSLSSHGAGLQWDEVEVEWRHAFVNEGGEDAIEARCDTFMVIALVHDGGNCWIPVWEERNDRRSSPWLRQREEIEEEEELDETLFALF